MAQDKSGIAKKPAGRGRKRKQEYTVSDGWYAREDGSNAKRDDKTEDNPDKLRNATYEERIQYDKKHELKGNIGSYVGVIQRLKSFEGKLVGTYNYETGELEELTDGYMVTFYQNEPDENGHYKSHYGRYTEEEYDKLTADFAKDNDAEVYIGVFDDEPEISFKVKTAEQARALMIKYNQKSLWDNAKGEEFANTEHYDKTKNPMKGD